MYIHKKAGEEDDRAQRLIRPEWRDFNVFMPLHNAGAAAAAGHSMPISTLPAGFLLNSRGAM